MEEVVDCYYKFAGLLLRIFSFADLVNDLELLQLENAGVKRLVVETMILKNILADVLREGIDVDPVSYTHLTLPTTPYV